MQKEQAEPGGPGGEKVSLASVARPRFNSRVDFKRRNAGAFARGPVREFAGVEGSARLFTGRVCHFLI